MSVTADDDIVVEGYLRYRNSPHTRLTMPPANIVGKYVKLHVNSEEIEDFTTTIQSDGTFVFDAINIRTKGSYLGTLSAGDGNAISSSEFSVVVSGFLFCCHLYISFVC